MTSSEAEKFRIACELADTGIALQRQNFRRGHPEHSEGQIDQLLEDWLVDRPMDYSPT